MKKLEVAVFLLITVWQICEQENVPLVPLFWKVVCDLSVWVSNGAWELARVSHGNYIESVSA